MSRFDMATDATLWNGPTIRAGYLMSRTQSVQHDHKM